MSETSETLGSTNHTAEDLPFPPLHRHLKTPGNRTYEMSVKVLPRTDEDLMLSMAILMMEKTTSENGSVEQDFEK